MVYGGSMKREINLIDRRMNIIANKKPLSRLNIDIMAHEFARFRVPLIAFTM